MTEKQGRARLMQPRILGLRQPGQEGGDGLAGFMSVATWKFVLYFPLLFTKENWGRVNVTHPVTCYLSVLWG